MNAGIYGVVVVAIIVALWLLFWMRGRRLGGGPAGWSGRIDLSKGFPHTRGRGYQASDVDAVLDRAYARATDEESRGAALEDLHVAQFELVRGGYDPVVVDLHVDAMIVALQTGRDLPARPGTPRA